MPTPTYIPLGTITLASAVSSVTFSSIPATYRDLIVVFQGVVTSNGVGLQMRLNGDTGNNYSNVQMSGSTSPSTSSTSNSGISFIGVAGQNYGVGTDSANPSHFISQIMDYSATDKHKTVLTRWRAKDSSGDEVAAGAGRYAITTAVSSVLVRPSSGSFAIGSTFQLFGVN